MDWTGGARRRFAPKKNNATLQKQKAYFARARAALNGPSQSHASRSPTKGYSTLVLLSPQLRSESRHNNGHWLESRSESKTTSHEVAAGQIRGRSVSGTQHHTYHSEKRKYRSPSFISISSREHSSRTSASKTKPAAQQQTSRDPAVTSNGGMNEEERLLLARRRLLAKSDWLGLAPARPAHMKFSSSNEKERIGKRRKIDKTRSKKGEPAGRRLLTPLFEQCLQAQDHMMRGALLADDFQIRVGTDVLATQTQHSRRSHNSGRTSMRQPSTEFESLSEESMLLGADEDNFDSFQVLYDATTPQETATVHVQQLCDVAHMSRAKHQPESHENSEVRRNFYQSERQQENRGNPISDVREQINNELMPTDQELHRSTTAVARPASQSIKLSDQHRHGNEAGQQSNTVDENRDHHTITPQDDDDEIWRRFLSVAQRISSNPSMEALKSSSLHLTTSESSHRPVLVRSDPSDEDIRAWISTPNGAGTQGPTVLNDQAADPLTESDSSAKLSSPSTSLKHITKLATYTAPPSAVPQEKRDEDELWRAFILESQDDSESTSQLDFNLSKENVLVDRAKSLTPGSASYIVSDLGTSNKTTIGEDTLVVGESLSSTNSHDRHPSLQHKIQHPRDLESTSAQNSAPPIDCDGDSIEDDEAADRLKNRSKNMHAPRTTTLNPKRFLPPQKRYTPPQKRSSSFLPPRGWQNKVPKPQRSVYDLVDSDGNSLS